MHMMQFKGSLVLCRLKSELRRNGANHHHTGQRTRCVYHEPAWDRTMQNNPWNRPRESGYALCFRVSAPFAEVAGSERAITFCSSDPGGWIHGQCSMIPSDISSAAQ